MHTAYRMTPIWDLLDIHFNYVIYAYHYCKHSGNSSAPLCKGNDLAKVERFNHWAQFIKYATTLACSIVHAPLNTWRSFSPSATIKFPLRPTPTFICCDQLMLLPCLAEPTISIHSSHIIQIAAKILTKKSTHR